MMKHRPAPAPTSKRDDRQPRHSGKPMSELVPGHGAHRQRDDRQPRDSGKPLAEKVPGT